MAFLDQTPSPHQRDLLISVVDIAQHARWARSVDDSAAFAGLAAWYAMIGGLVAVSGGRCVKCMGDAVLIVHPPEAAPAAVRALANLCDEGDAWLAQRMPGCRHQIKVHAGSAVCGRLGTPGHEILDVIGHAVNACFLLPAHGLSLSVAAFRALDPETRRLFKKHTPPVTYIPLAAPHRD